MKKIIGRCLKKVKTRLSVESVVESRSESKFSNSWLWNLIKREGEREIRKMSICMTIQTIKYKIKRYETCRNDRQKAPVNPKVGWRTNCFQAKYDCLDAGKPGSTDSYAARACASNKWHWDKSIATMCLDFCCFLVYLVYWTQTRVK